jgi:hypothetical protein
MGLSIDSWIVCWTPAWAEHAANDPSKPGAILVAPLGSNSYWDDRYDYTGGMCYTDRHSMTLVQKVLMMFIDFNTCVVRDGIDPQAAHREFLKIDEYRKRISPDTPGADGTGPNEYD